ncbi:helix-turn-helix domain-containing protein [Eupransor demetentiae]|uniref:Contains Cro/C1-type HTH and peptisase s24 domains n=1 Tax=Eupransor demetentiae TaxID=3109584 RepID=A0ABP0EPZ1_9LACO|nr:Phage repressor protein C [Lactobacillaceae bacterium LMG 33000]
MDFAEQLKKLRNKRQLSLDRLAQELNQKYDSHISKSMLSRWEHGGDIQMSYVRILADFFQIPPALIIDDPASQNWQEFYQEFQQLNPGQQEKVVQFAKNLRADNKDEFAAHRRQNGSVEVYGAVSAGTGQYLSEPKPESEAFDGPIPDYDFAVRVSGDSMLPLFSDQELIFVKKTTAVRSGQIVIANYDQQAYVKKYIDDKAGRRLVSLNANYPDLPIEAGHEVSLLGVVIL